MNDFIKQFVSSGMGDNDKARQLWRHATAYRTILKEESYVDEGLAGYTSKQLLKLKRKIENICNSLNIFANFGTVADIHSVRFINNEGLVVAVENT
jgi:hypothetical protein